MEKNHEAKEQLNDKNCSFCFPSTEQIRSILRISFYQLKKMAKQKRYADMPLINQQNNGAFSRYIRVLFDQHQFELKMSKGCSHFRLKNMFRDRLRCRNDQFEVLIDDLCDKIARRNYQLEIISSQIKNVETSVCGIEEIAQVPESDFKNPTSPAIFYEEQKAEVKNSQKAEEEPQVKVEEIVEPVAKTNDGSPSTVLPIMTTTFGEMPYSYNFLFYGNYYH